MFPRLLVFVRTGYLPFWYRKKQSNPQFPKQVKMSALIWRPLSLGTISDLLIRGLELGTVKYVRKSICPKEWARSGDIAQWNWQRLQSCGHGFEWHAQFKLYICQLNSNVKRTKIKQKRGRDSHIFYNLPSYILYPNKQFITGGSPGLVVMGGGSLSEGCGFESRHHILHGYLDIFHINML